MTVVFIWFLSPPLLPIDTHSKYIHVCIPKCGKEIERYTCVNQSMGRKLRDGGEKQKTGTNILSFVVNCNDYKEVTLIHIQNIIYFQIHSICIFLKYIYIYM